MDDVDIWLAQVLSHEDADSEFGRVRAYRKCVRYAEEQLFDDHRCNLFLLRAAERLGQPPMAIDVVHHLVPLPDKARAMFYYSEEEGPVLVGNKHALRYFSKLLGELAKSRLPGENVILEEGVAPFLGDSYGLTIYCENEAWFDAVEEGTEEEYVGQWETELHGRIVSSEEIAAFQLSGPVPTSLAISPQKIYKVTGLAEFRPDGQIPRKPYRQELNQVRVVSFVDDDGHQVQLGLDLEDPDVTFYYSWHLDQLAGA